MIIRQMRRGQFQILKSARRSRGKVHLDYTITFHGDKDAGLVFDDGSDVNEVVYNSSGQIVEGVFKIPKGWGGKCGYVVYG